MRLRTLLLLVMLLTAGSSLAQKTMKQKEERAQEIVEQLPEVKAFYSGIKDTTVHGCAMIAKDPDRSFKYFWVKVGWLDPYLFTTAYHFYVDPSTNNVLYFSTVYDTVISLQYWRKHKDKY